jgi:hypothetical protein
MHQRLTDGRQDVRHDLYRWYEVWGIIVLIDDVVVVIVIVVGRRDRK